MLLGDGMARAYSSDLRVRVIRAVEGGFFGARSGAPIGYRRVDGDRLGWPLEADRECRGQIAEGPQPLTAEGAHGLAIGADRRAGRSHSGRDPRAARRAWRWRWCELDLAVFRPAWHQL